MGFNNLFKFNILTCFFRETKAIKTYVQNTTLQILRKRKRFKNLKRSKAVAPNRWKISH